MMESSSLSSILNIALLVFREGLECVLVLSAITASMVRGQRGHRRPVAFGAAIGFAATLVTWVIAVRILDDLTVSISALNLQAATGLGAVVVLLIVMNWFFHRTYWGGWIGLHTRRKKELLGRAENREIPRARLAVGLLLLGFSSMYREGLEVVLFLQSFRLKFGGAVVGIGALLGGGLTMCVALLTFVAHRHLPYRRMLVLTGMLLGAVLLVMVGEQAQEMQLAGWIPTTEIPALSRYIPPWMGVWFSLFPTVETFVAQAIAAVLVIGSYVFARQAKRGQTG